MHITRWLATCCLALLTFSACKKDHTLNKHDDKITAINKWHASTSYFWDFKTGGDSVTTEQKDVNMTLKIDGNKNILYESKGITYAVPPIEVTEYSIDYELKVSDTHNISIKLNYEHNNASIREVIWYDTYAENITLYSY